MSSKATKFSIELLHPRYWVSWFVFTIWWLVSQLPYPVLLNVGRGLGLLAFQFKTSRKSIAERNIQLCFPQLNVKQRQRLLRKNFINLGIAIMEIGIAWWWSKKRFARLLQIDGAENLWGTDSGGILLLGIHYTTLEIGAAAASTVHDRVDGMYRAHRNKVYDYLQARGRISKSCGNSMVYERNDVRGSLRALKSGRILWYGPDQDYGLGSGLFAPFFGIQAATVHTTARFAQLSGAKVIPFTHIRLNGNQGYQVTFYPPIENFPSGDELRDATMVNEIIEDFIMLKPDQYLWVHRRFKTRPPGEEDFYTTSSGS